MARSFSSLKIMSTLDGFCNALIRRRYAAAAVSQGVAEGVLARSSTTVNKEEVERSTEKPSWVPDPITGYYRPENYVDEIDAVDLRARLLKPRSKLVN